MSRADVLLHRSMHRLTAARTRFGTPGLLGVALLAFAAAALFDAGRVHREAAVRKIRLGAVPAHRRFSGASLPAQPMSPDDRLARFRNALPPVDASVSDLRTIFHAAAESGVALTRGDYSLTMVARSAALARYDAVFPLHGSYALVKHFIAKVLAQLPHASLAALDVERPNAGAAELNARVHFTLYYRLGDAS